MRSRLALVVVLLGLAAPARAVDVPRRLELHGELLNLFHFRNDSDFDRSRPFYDENGQSVGAFATLFRPRATLHIASNLRVHYEVELGLNFWSKQNPDQQAALAPDVFVLKHRELWAAGELLGGSLGFKAGYSYFRDPSGLFLAHWIGNAQAWGAWRRGGGGRAGLFVGEVPDQTYEGILLTENNFKRDILVFGATAEHTTRRGLRFAAAVSGLVDTHLVGQRRTVVCPSARLEQEWGRWHWFAEAALQGGVLQAQAQGGEDQRLLAWALQAGARVALPRARLELAGNLLALSPDDAHEGNRWSHAFLYSGKSRSATLLLTEDELRDWYDNVDERMGGYRGGFFQNRAGLLVADLRASFAPRPWLRPSLVLAAATVLKAANALDARFVGFESDLVVELRASQHLALYLAVAALAPGRAAGALVNRIDRNATDAQLMTEASLAVRF